MFGRLCLQKQDDRESDAYVFQVAAVAYVPGQTIEKVVLDSAGRLDIVDRTEALKLLYEAFLHC